jgi:hypothetical protein
MTEGAESTCKHCLEPIIRGAGRWWHRAGWFSLCKNRVTHAEPAPFQGKQAR